MNEIHYRKYKKFPAVLGTMDIFEADAHATGTVVEYWQGILDIPVERYPNERWYRHNQAIAQKKLAEYIEAQKGMFI